MSPSILGIKTERPKLPVPPSSPDTSKCDDVISKFNVKTRSKRQEQHLNATQTLAQRLRTVRFHFCDFFSQNQQNRRRCVGAGAALGVRLRQVRWSTEVHPTPGCVRLPQKHGNYLTVSTHFPCFCSNSHQEWQNFERSRNFPSFFRAEVGLELVARAAAAQFWLASPPAAAALTTHQPSARQIAPDCRLIHVVQPHTDRARFSRQTRQRSDSRCGAFAWKHALIRSHCSYAISYSSTVVTYKCTCTFRKTKCMVSTYAYPGL